MEYLRDASNTKDGGKTRQMKKIYSGIYIVYSSFSATEHSWKCSSTSSFLAIIDNTSPFYRFTSCYYTVQFLTLELINLTMEVKKWARER